MDLFPSRNREWMALVETVRLHHQAALARLSHQALVDSELEPLIRQAVALAQETLQTTSCQLLEHRPQEGGFLLRGESPPSPASDPLLPQTETFLAAFTQEQAEPVTVVDWRAESRFPCPARLADQQVVSSLSVPILGEDGPWGVLQVHETSLRLFSEDEVNFLQAVANLLAVARQRIQGEQALQASEARFRTLMETAPTAILMVDRAGRIVGANQRAEELFGYSRPELLDRPLNQLLPPDLRDSHAAHMAAFFQTPRTRPMGQELELVAQRRDGARFPVEVGLSQMTVQGETLAIAFITDITARRQAAQALQHQAAELEKRVEERTQEIERRRQAAEGLREILAVLNSNRPLDEILSRILAQAERLIRVDAAAIYRLDREGGPLRLQVALGMDRTFVHHLTVPLGWGAVGRAIQERRPVIIPDNSALFAEIVTQTNPDAHPHLRDFLVRHAIRYRSVLSVPIITRNGVYGGLSLYQEHSRHFSHEEVALVTSLADHAALAIENARLREQAELSAAAAERSRLARDLHDAVTQTLFSTSIIAEVLPLLWERNPDEGRRRLRELQELTRGALAEMRTLLLELRPSALIEAHLPDLLRQLAEAITGRARVPISVTVDGEGQLPSEVRIALYRIAQEALNNVARHANASQAWVHLRYFPLGRPSQQEKAARVELVIQDNGSGFEPSQDRPGHLGLKIMRERAQDIDAVLSLASRPGEGTRITVRWPGYPGRGPSTLTDEKGQVQDEE